MSRLRASHDNARGRMSALSLGLYFHTVPSVEGVWRRAGRHTFSCFCNYE